MAGKKGMKQKEKVMHDPYNFAAVTEKFRKDQKAEKEKARLEKKKEKEQKARQKELAKIRENQRKLNVQKSKLANIKAKAAGAGTKGPIVKIQDPMLIREKENLRLANKYRKFSNGGSMKNKSKGKVVKYTGKHKLDKYLTRDQIKKLDPFGVDLLLQVQEGANKGKKKKMGGVMKNRGGTFKGVY
mgnify:CR=1 FL=1